MNEPFIATIGLFGFNFAPKYWAFCAGQLLPIAQNTALFSLIGTTYGGDGRVTFALPDLRGRGALGQGNGPGLTPRVIGEAAGSETVTLLQAQMPTHNHTLAVSGAPGTQTTPVGNVTAQLLLGEEQPQPLFNATPNAIASPQAISVAGGNQPHQNMQPYLALNYCIALQGIFPSRS